MLQSRYTKYIRKIKSSTKYHYSKSIYRHLVRGGGIFVNTPNLDEACDALNIYDIDYDLDDGDRIMVDDSFYDDVLDAFEEYDIEYEEV